MNPRDLLVWLVVTASLVSIAYVMGLSRGLGTNADSTLRAIDTAVYYGDMADSAWAIVGERHGLASDVVRQCMAAERTLLVEGR